MAITIAKCHSVTKVDWSRIDVVLLDMDGTLLDLSFDNQFWLETIPAEFARRNALTVAEAKAQLTPKFQAQVGKLNWYCIDYWSQVLGFSVAELKRSESHGVNWRPEAEEFLKYLKASHCDAVLVTNAHPETLAIKLERVNLAPWLDKIFTSHEFRAPKESPLFWDRLIARYPFDPKRALFIDDSEPVLAAARRFGIEHVVTLRQPDSTGPVRQTTGHPAIHHFSEIFAGLPGYD
ncbi:MAG: hypothetical protein RLZZ602_1122 [Pseudomonadota bacterium]